MPPPHFIEDCPSWLIPGTPWRLYGYSRAGERTGFMIPQLKCMFDAGMNAQKTPDHIFVTHSHCDHSFYVPCLAMGHKELEEKPRVYCPADMAPPLSLLARASQSLNDCVPLVDDPQVNCQPVRGGDELSLTVKKTRLHVAVFECCHTVPSVGFLVSTLAKTLLPQYQALADAKQGKALATLRQQGVELYQTRVEPAFAFCGDTTVGVFERSPEILRAPVIVVECTAFGDDSITACEARARGHIHWDDLRPTVVAHPHTRFVLIHFSPRYSDLQLQEYFQQQNLHNVVLWLTSGVLEL